jgi:AcrR family transcriptional regulator
VAAAQEERAGVGRRPAARLGRERRRQEIVEAAARVLAGRDPAAVTFEEVAEAAGVSRALVYNYFGDKGSLVAAVYLRSLERLDDEVAAAVDRRLPPRERLRQLVASALRFARTDEAAWHLAAGGATLHPAVRAARERRVDRLAADLGGGTNAAVVAAAVVAVLDAATAVPADPDTVVDALTALLWGGLSSLERFGVALSDPEADGPEGGDRLLGAGQAHLGG